MMNVFEDLIVELKEDQLLEETVADFPESFPNYPNGYKSADLVFDDNPAETEKNNSQEQKTGHIIGDKKKFTSEEISALQMVEHVFTSVERDVLGVTPKSYDELGAKQALHRFVHSSAEVGSDEAVELEANLDTEIENWKDSLLAREAKMSPANIRVYCETSQPPLSSQALFALARFYFSTGLKAAAATKLDFVLTRLFSKKDEGERRSALVNKEETIAHLRKRFSDWTGASADEIPESMLSVLSFEDFTTEAEKVENLDEFLKGDFFNRLILFKESVREQLKSPEVAAACLRCNIAVGNAVVESLEKFGQKTNEARLKKKFGSLDDDLIAQAIGRTLDLDLLLTVSLERPSPLKETNKRVEAKEQPRSPKAAAKKESSRSSVSGLFAVNKKLLLAAAILITASVGLFVWTNYYSADQSVSVKVPAVELNGFENRDAVKTAKISNETMYAQMTPAWDALSDEKKLEFVKKLYDFASKKGVKKLNVMDIHGTTVAFATPEHQGLAER
jgi:hypothetical protein